MTLTATDVITPLGRIDLAVIWPGVNEDTARGYVGEYLAQGYSQAGAAQHGAAEQWAYYRAFQTAYERLLLRPSTVTMDGEGTTSYLLTQMEHVGQLAAAALAEYEGIVGSTSLTGGDFAVITSLR